MKGNLKMKKSITCILTITMVLSLMFCIVGCGDNVKKQEAIDAFNTTSTSFDETADLINENAEVLDEELISVFQEMSSLLGQYKELLEGEDELTDEKYDEIIEWLGTADDWIKDTKNEIETALAQ